MKLFTKTILGFACAVLFITSCNIGGRFASSNKRGIVKQNVVASLKQGANLEKKLENVNLNYMGLETFKSPTLEVKTPICINDLSIKDNIWLSGTLHSHSKQIKSSKANVKEYIKRKVLNNAFKKAKTNDDEKDEGIPALRILGWLIWATGILIILFVSILGGLIIGLLGSLLVWVGRKKNIVSQNTEKKNDDKSELVDVVYLKNGGVIRGMIIEQIPGISIKIQTKDGNVFVYKMEEIEKMTKEQSK